MKSIPSQALQSMRDEYEGPSTQAQSTWFPALMAALFVMLALGAIATMYSAVKGTRPQLAAAGTMGLWLLAQQPNIFASFAALGMGSAFEPWEHDDGGVDSQGVRQSASRTQILLAVDQHDPGGNNDYAAALTPHENINTPLCAADYHFG